jgi:hypothetical protein
MWAVSRTRSRPHETVDMARFSTSDVRSLVRVFALRIYRPAWTECAALLLPWRKLFAGS